MSRATEGEIVSVFIGAKTRPSTDVEIAVSCQVKDTAVRYHSISEKCFDMLMTIADCKIKLKKKEKVADLKGYQSAVKYVKR